MIRYPSPFLAAKKFSDDHTHKTQADIDLHIADDSPGMELGRTTLVSAWCLVPWSV